MSEKHFLGHQPGTTEETPVLEQADDSKLQAVVVSVAGTNDVVETQLTPSEQKRHHRVREHLEERRERKVSKQALTDKSEYGTSLVGVNLRDVGAVTHGPMRKGALFRSSELLSKEEMRKNTIRTILDLRRMDRPCKKSPHGSKTSESTRTVIKYLLWGPAKVLPEKRLLYIHRAHPQSCELCDIRAQERLQIDIHVFHADLIPSTVGLRIFQAMPARVRAKALLMACVPGRGAASVMAPAVANPLLLGYKALYRTLLEDSKRGMAMALRTFVEEGNYPILVHCIHGKDRTGLIIMLLLMLCDVQPDAIVDDYVLSETVLKESRMHDELKLDVYLTSDDVIAATRDTMEDTIAYVNTRYGSAAGYMHEIGLEEWETAQIRSNLTSKAKPVPEEELKAPSRPRLSISNFFGRFSSAPSTEQVAAHKRLSRTSVPLPRPSPTLEEGPEPPADSSGDGSSPATPQAKSLFRRASLANSGPQEIRGIFKQLREQHPELGPLSEEGEPPFDFLRDSPTPKTKSCGLPAGLQQVNGDTTMNGHAADLSLPLPAVKKESSLQQTAPATVNEPTNRQEPSVKKNQTVKGLDKELPSSPFAAL